MLLEEFDSEKQAMLNPSDLLKKVEGMPEVAVSCYSHVTFERMISEMDVEIIATTSFANGVIPIYKTVYKGKEVALFMMSVGAPMSAAILDDVYQMGVQRAVVFGTCGVLDKKIDDCSIIIPNRAMRDEGTSYHYVEVSDEIEVNEKHLDKIKKLLDELNVSYMVGKAWTTDGIYRETAKKMKRRKEQGCICVDMECSADAAVAKFRDKELVQFFYAADNLDAEEWDKRSLGNHDKLEEKDRIATIALEIAVSIL